MSNGSRPARSSQADVGATREVRVGAAPALANNTSCRVTRNHVSALLRTPVRDLTLWQAAHVVAHLHHAGAVRLLSAPRFSADCAALEHPGPGSRHAGRFVVSLENRVSASGHEVQFLALVKTGRPPAPRGYRFASVPINHVDVRTVVLLYHLVDRIAPAMYLGQQKLRAVIHDGFNGKEGDRRDRVPRRAGATAIYTLHDCHWSGRALDLSGLVVGTPGQPPVTAWPDRRVDDEHVAIIKDHWGAVTHASGPTGYRLEADLARPGTPAGERARLFRDVLRVFEEHATVGRSGWRSGMLIHPDHTDPGLHAAHQDHIHAQLGSTRYEFPTDAARLADLRSTDLHANERGTRAEQHRELGGVGVSTLGRPITQDAAERAP